MTRPSYGEVLERLRAAQKTTKGAPAYSRFVNRPLGRRLAAAAFLLGRTPDQVTALSGTLTGAGIVTLALAPSRWWAGLLVTALLVVGYALDAADGQLARLRGGGSKAGEWLDHVVDAAKAPALHLAVLVHVERSGELPGAYRLVPLAFAVVASTFFFTIILNDQLRRAAGTRDGQAAAPVGEQRQHSALRSLLALPADYGLLCLVVLLLGWSDAFAWAYGTLCGSFTVVFLLSMLKWYREMRSLDALPAVVPDRAPSTASPRLRTGEGVR